MQQALRSLFGLLLLVGAVASARGQVPPDSARFVTDSATVVHVDRIFIIGNRKTKARIIRREMSAQPQTSYPWGELQEILENDRQRIVNTRLFLRVDVRPVFVNEGLLDLIVSVDERWYTIPSPYVKFADRNINDWLTNFGLDFGRLEYGLKVTQYNFRGLNERIQVDAQLGFTRRLAVSYSRPYIDRAQKNGLAVNFSFAETNNIIYQTEGHRPLSTDSLRRSLETLSAGVGWSHRGSYYSTHAVDVNYFHNHIKDTITEINPQYFLDGRREQRYLRLGYRFFHDKRDFVAYPQRGFFVSVNAQKLGLGVFDDINLWRLTTLFTHYTPLSPRWSVATTLHSYVSGPRRQPYANFLGLGFQNLWLRGYETYTIQGQHFVLQQNDLRWQAFNTVFNLDRIIPFDQFNKIPMAVYLKVFYDQGGVNNSVDYPLDQRLRNRYLYSAGVGLDMVSFYDFVFRIGYPLLATTGVERQYFLSFRAFF
jgi:outer membrane protein assembly factor BamA